MVSLKLDPHVRRDPRILTVYLEARRRYDALGPYHHSFLHALRDLSRALQIAAESPGVDHGVLIPAVLLHDIGFCSPRWKKQGHDVEGARIAEEILPGLGYGRLSVEAICHCIRAHKGKAEEPRSREAQILYDSDVLEKAALVFLIFAGKIICEFDESLAHFLQRELVDRAAELKRGFYTPTAKLMDGGKLETVLSLLSQIQFEITQERPEFSLKEEDLWLDYPPRQPSAPSPSVLSESES